MTRPTLDLTKPLQVFFGSMRESNGKANWTAIVHRGDFTDGITLARSEYKDRVRYEADRMRYLLGELGERPYILDYDGELIVHDNDEEYAKWEKRDRELREEASPLRQAAEQFVASVGDGNVAELIEYYADIFRETLGEK